ncbi:hypothetical protein EVAR_30481_1 [Eumeta japonica]|uniref:Uncharacterized protein n=1 Tax=Eumeta variegata TaxID=151549 RepID=A0A4C1W034_EUMVA|nr:hypothetical protein EVAR_30481_1 [Eumeta japonica]
MTTPRAREPPVASRGRAGNNSMSADATAGSFEYLAYHYQGKLTSSIINGRWWFVGPTARHGPQRPRRRLRRPRSRVGGQVRKATPRSHRH